MPLDRTIDLCAEALYGLRFRTGSYKPPPTSSEVGRRDGNKKIRVRTLFSEATFIASAFFGAAYRFPFLVVEEEEAGRVAFCFEVCNPFTLP